MEPTIRYTRTDDGVSIAYWCVGEGRSVVITPYHTFSHVRMEWEYEPIRRMYERLASIFRLFRYDRRGTGLSERVLEMSPESEQRDLGAVMREIGDERAVLVGRGYGGPAAVRYAATHPGRASHLVLYDTVASTEDWRNDAAMRAQRAMIESLGEGNSEAIALAPQLGFSSHADWFSTFIREGAGFAGNLSYGVEFKDDVSELLPEVQCPTLVVMERDAALSRGNTQSILAQRIPRAELKIVDREPGDQWVDMVDIADIVCEFVGEAVPPSLDRSQPSVASEATVMTSLPEAKSFAGRYALQRVLGEGAQKIVYLVHDEVLDRDCALSFIKASTLDSEGRARFQREARTMAALGAQPNVVTVFDLGEEEGKPFLVSEYVPGGDLRLALQEASGPFEIDRAIAIASNLARALALAHQRGIIHRDVKPGNVWLTDRGIAKLGDFGLAMTLDRSQLTAVGTIMGTAAYMSPEQALGSTADARSDLYSLGCVFYEMVTGRAPFMADDALAVISQHINTAPVAPSWHNSAVSPHLDSLILRLLAKSPDERPSDAFVVLNDLTRISESKHEQTPPTSPAVNADLQGISWGGFVGRRAELEQLRGALEDSLSGKGRLVTIAGEAGIGKSRLTQEFAVYARLRGACALSGQCYAEVSAPYGPLVEAFREYARGLDDETLRSQLGEGAPEIATLVTDLRARFPDIVLAPSLDAEGERMRLFESATTFFRNAAEMQPLFVIVEDLHWADKSTLLMLRYLLRGIGDARVLLVGTYRDVEIADQHPLSETLAELARQENYQRLRLGGLAEGDVEQLVAAIEPAEDVRGGRLALATALHQETEGNPFFMREVLSHLVEERKLYRQEGRWTSTVADVADLGIPRTLREVLGRRLSRLSDSCRSMLTSASAIARRFSWDELQTLSAENEEVLLDLLDEALASQLIVEERRGTRASYSFAHALIRQTLYDELSTPRRSLLHRRIGEALEVLYAADLEPHLADLAFHFSKGLRSDNADRAIDYAVRAARMALAQTAYEEAARLYEIAVSASKVREPSDNIHQCELLLTQGQALMSAGEVEHAKDSFLRVAEIARAMGYGEALARATLEFGRRDFEALDFDQRLVDLIEDSMRMLGDANPTLQVQLMARQARELSHSFEPGERLRGPPLSLRALERARALGDDETLFMALEAGWWTLYDTAAIKQRLNLCNDMVDCARRLQDRTRLFWANDTRSCDLLQIGDLKSFEDDLRAMGGIASALRQPTMSFNLKAIQSMLAFLNGEIEDGKRLFREVLTNAELVFGPPMMHYYQAMIAPCEFYWDNRFAQDVESSINRLIERGGYKKTLLQFRLAYFYCELNRIEDARNVIKNVHEEDFNHLCESGFILPVAIAARVVAGVGVEDRAHALYVALQAYGDSHVTNGNQSYLGAASQYLGMLATSLGRYDDAIGHFEHALEMTRSINSRPWIARTELDYGEMLLGRNNSADRQRARDLLDEALSTAQELSMAMLTKAEALRSSLN